MTKEKKYDAFIESMNRSRSIALDLNVNSWVETIDDLLFEAIRIKKTETLEEKWNAFFKANIAPDYQAVLEENPGMTIVFGYLGIESHLPDTISFEDLGTGFSKTRSFDPESIDMVEFIKSFAAEAFQ